MSDTPKPSRSPEHIHHLPSFQHRQKGAQKGSEAENLVDCGVDEPSVSNLAVTDGTNIL